MAWNLTVGVREDEIRRSAEQLGIPSKLLESKPRLERGLEYFYDAFQILTNSRPVGMGAVLPIPLSEIKAYLEITEVRDIEDRVTFIKMMQSLDAVYTNQVNDNLKRNREANQKK